MLLNLFHIKLCITFQGYEHYNRVPSNTCPTCTYKNKARIPSKISKKTRQYYTMLHNQQMEDYKLFL
jgi:hypothetical protein